MPLYRLERQSLKETIPPGNYMYDPPNGLPRITVRIDGETTAEELAEAVRKEYGSAE